MFLNAYYFRAHMYTLVPRQVREDMQWMADVGTNAVSIAVLEQDLYAAVSNIDIICHEADRVGMQVHVVPSRWGGIVAGAPKVPSQFTITNPQTWMLDESGRAIHSSVSGAMSSIYHPDTTEFFIENLSTVLKQWPIAGIVFDEPKVLHGRDFCDLARARHGDTFDDALYVSDVAAFFGTLCKHIKRKRGDARTSLFLYASERAEIVDVMAATESLDYFGCDGRPWGLADGGRTDGAADKVLLGRAERFVEAARRNGKEGLILIENHNMRVEDNERMDRRLPQVLRLGAEHVLYYYYPRNLEDPDANMSILAKHVRECRASNGG
ncbi:MAG: hypothetical protein GF331_06350 [Chitinivibrionales bacterium]|nr:hypothetical protein [Chitinivibrionales bacterium]